MRKGNSYDRRQRKGEREKGRKGEKEKSKEKQTMLLKVIECKITLKIMKEK